MSVKVQGKKQPFLQGYVFAFSSWAQSPQPKLACLFTAREIPPQTLTVLSLSFSHQSHRRFSQSQRCQKRHRWKSTHYANLLVSSRLEYEQTFPEIVVGIFHYIALDLIKCKCLLVQKVACCKRLRILRNVTCILYVN